MIDLHMVWRHLLGASTARLLDRLFDNARHEQFQRFRCKIQNSTRILSTIPVLTMFSCRVRVKEKQTYR